MIFKFQLFIIRFALQQSLLESGTESEQVDIWEALKATRPMSPANLTDEDAQLQRLVFFLNFNEK